MKTTYKIQSTTIMGNKMEVSGTLKELIKYYAYTLERGKAYEYERGNARISLRPRTIESLVRNVNEAYANCAANHHSPMYIELVGTESD